MPRDPDAQPMSDEDFAQARRVPRVKTVRRAPGLMQEKFAARFHRPVGALRGWEQGRAEPDRAARAYVRAIAGDPAAIARALAPPGRAAL